jgi:hypothetical protein
VGEGENRKGVGGGGGVREWRGGGRSGSFLY